MRWTALGVALTLLAFGLAACTSQTDEDEAATEASPYQNVAQEVEFVGDETCGQCHGELYQSYQTHGMAQSFYAMTPERAVEDFGGVTLTHEGSGFTYTVYQEGDQFVQEEYRLGLGGEKTHRLARTMDFVVGSGSAARTYLSQVNGRLYEMPLTWYTQAERWDFSPGYDLFNQRFDRTVPPRCMACHNGYSEPVDFAEGKFASLADGIGCESCHGPGALHTEARTSSPEAPEEIDYTIVNPKHLSLERRLDVCQQCHLHGEVSILREGESAYSYRPSRPLSAHRSLYVLENDDPDRVSVISHADRMKQSACFVESSTMDCVTCHDPHEGFRSQGPEYFNVTCRECHEAEALQLRMPTAALREQHKVGANCFSCHMPKVEADDAPHASFTDHWIRVVGDDEIEGTARKGETSTLIPYFEDGRDDAVDEGMAYVVYGRNEGGSAAMRRGASMLEQALGADAGRGEAHFLLGFARLQLRQARQAVEPLRRSIAVKPNPERLNALAQALERIGSPPSEVEPLYRQALEMQPQDANTRVNYGRFLESQGRLAQAVAAYRRALSDAPWLATAHYNLGTVLLRQGNAQGARDALREAVRLAPDNADALLNLGILTAQTGDEERAGRLFERAVRAEPQNANALGNLALYRLQQNQPEAAYDLAQRALSIDPSQGTAQQVMQILQQTAAPQ